MYLDYIFWVLVHDWFESNWYISSDPFYYFFLGNLFVCMLKNLALLSFLYHKFVDMSMD